MRSSGPRIGEHDAELRCVGCDGLLRCTQHFAGIEERRRLHRGLEPRGLRAEVTVLGAAAGLRREDALHLDLRTASGEADLVGEGRERGDEPVGKGGQSGELLCAQQAFLDEQRPLGRVEAVTGHRGVDLGPVHLEPPRRGSPAQADGRRGAGGATDGGSLRVAGHAATVVAPVPAATQPGRTDRRRTPDGDEGDRRGMGLLDRTRVRGAACLDAHVRARGDLPARDPRARP